MCGASRTGWPRRDPRDRLRARHRAPGHSHPARSAALGDRRGHRHRRPLHPIDGSRHWFWGADPQVHAHAVRFACFDVGGVALPISKSGRWGLSSPCSSSGRLPLHEARLGAAARCGPPPRPLVGVRVDRCSRSLGARIRCSSGQSPADGRASQFSLSPTFMQPILVYAFAASVLGGLDGRGSTGPVGSRSASR